MRSKCIEIMNVSLFASAVALALSALWTPQVHAVACTNPSIATEYAVVRAEMTTCETLTGLTLTLPTTGSKKKTFCAECTELKDGILSSTIPSCKITQSDGQSYQLQKLLEKLFRPCVGGSSASDSAPGSSSETEDAKDATATSPTPSSSSDDGSSTDPQGSSNVTDSGSSTQSSGSRGSALVTSDEGRAPFDLLSLSYSIMLRHGSRN